MKSGWVEMPRIVWKKNRSSRWTYIASEWWWIMLRCVVYTVCFAYIYDVRRNTSWMNVSISEQTACMHLTIGLLGSVDPRNQIGSGSGVDLTLCSLCNGTSPRLDLVHFNSKLLLLCSLGTADCDLAISAGCPGLCRDQRSGMWSRKLDDQGVDGHVGPVRS